VSSEALLEAWRAGDERAGDKLMQQHYRSVLRYFELNASWVAEDLTQRTFMACVERVAAIRDARSFPAYLMGIARRQLAMHLRAGSSDVGLEGVSEPVGRTGLSTLLARSREQILVLRALASLPRRPQLVLILTYWEQLSSAEIARAQGVNASTIRTQLERARVLFRKRLQSGGRGLPIGEGDEERLVTMMASLRSVG